MLKLSIQVKSEDWYQVLKLSQKIDIETWLDDQFIYSYHHKLLNILYLWLNLYISNMLITLIFNDYIE